MRETAIIFITCGFMGLLNCAKTPVPVEEIAVQRVIPNDVSRHLVNRSLARIDLQAGFENESVTIYVDNQKIFSKKITTNRSADLADSVEFVANQPRIQLRVLLENGRREWQCFINLEEGKYLGIQKVNHRVQLLQAQGPFGYM